MAGNILLLLHSDILLTRQALQTMLEVLLSRPDIGAVGPLTNDCYYGVQQGILIQGNVTGINSLHEVVQKTEQIFSDRQLGVFERYKNDLGFAHSADAEDTVWRG